MSKTIAPERTRYAVILDRFYAGLPFYYEATRAEERIALSSPERTFCGDPVTIIDHFDTHYVLQRTAGKHYVWPRPAGKRKARKVKP
jgi:hypothetical protein